MKTLHTTRNGSQKSTRHSKNSSSEPSTATLAANVRLDKSKINYVKVLKSPYSNIAPGTKGTALWSERLNRFTVTMFVSHPMESQPYFTGDKRKTTSTYAFKEDELELDLDEQPF